MNLQFVIGLDLGGTYIKAVLIDPQGHIRTRAVIETEAPEGPDHVIGRMRRAVDRLCERADLPLEAVGGIGVGTPGPISIAEGVVIKSANLPGWESVRLRDRLRELTDRPVSMTNDANAAAWGEFWLGAGRGAANMCLLTLGTGVGGGVIVDGELLHGHFDNAGELGHVIVWPGGEECRCGQRGCLEAYAAASHLNRRALDLASTGQSPALQNVLDAKQSIDVPDILACAQQGDGASVQLWEAACEAIAIACVCFQHLLNPQRILLGGGMSAAREHLLDPVSEKFKQLTWTLCNDRPDLCLAELGNDAGALGAAGWFLHLHEQGRL